MLDIQFVRENSETVKTGMKQKGEEDLSVVDRVLEVDQTWRDLVVQVDELRAESNTKAKQIGVLKGEGKHEEADRIIRETSKAKEEVKELEKKMQSAKKERDELLLKIPNLPHESVPVGSGEEDNKVVHSWGEPDRSDWRKPHWELAERTGWIDFDRGVKVAGAGFPFYRGDVARLQRTLINFFIDEAVGQGYEELQSPFFVNEDSARGTGQIPDKEDMMYEIARDGFFPIPTAEVPVTNFHRDEILPGQELPLRYVAYTPCWRREAGSHGKDVRGLNRLHQFDKVELVKIVRPEDSYEELESLRRQAEVLLEKLGLPYRTLLMCTGDMGFTQSKKYDLEVWSPGQKRWLEVSSCSNFTDYQARRLMLRYRNDDGKPEIAHTLNGSGLALPRVMAAILEAYQTEEGKVEVPEVLQERMGKKLIAES